MTEDTASKILEKLKKQEKEEGKLPLLLEFYKKLLQIQSGVQQSQGTRMPALSHETIQKRLRSGRPLLRFSELNLDWSTVQGVFARVTATLARYPQLFGELPENLKKPGVGRLLTKKAAEAWFNGKEPPRKIQDGISENLLQVIIQATLHPFLAIYARVYIDSVEQESWRRRYCPVCGGMPDLAFLEKEYGARWLVCSRCDSEWLFQRLECPYCGCQDQEKLSYYTDDEGMYRLYTCQNCQNYLKAIDLRKAGDEDILLPLQRLLTLDMDRQAREEGLAENKA